MSWSKVKSGKKPPVWWYHKIMCEIGWIMRNSNNKLHAWNMYYNHLNIMCDKYGFNLYGEKIQKRIR